MGSVKKVLAVTSRPEMKCGVGTYAVQFYNSLQRYGVKTNFVTHSHDFFGNEIDYGRKKDVYPVINSKPDWPDAAIQTALDGGYDVVSVQHEYGLYPDEQLVGFLDMATGRVPTMITYHSAYGRPNKREIRFMDETLKRVDAATFHCEYQRKAAERVLGRSLRNTFVVPHGARDDISYDTEACKKEFGYDGKLVFGHESWFAPNKGLFETVRIYELALELMKNGRDTMLVLVGGCREPGHKDYCEELSGIVENSPAKEQIIISNTDIDERDDIYRRIGSFDLIAGLYRHESQSGFDARAYACGKPGVCTDIEGWGAQARESGARIAVPPLAVDENRWATIDEAGSAKALARLIEDNALREEMSRNARRYVRGCIGWNVVGSRIYEIFCSIAQN